MTTPVVHVRLWDRIAPEFATGGFGRGLFIDAYETLEPPWHRQTLFIADGMEIRTCGNTIEFGHYGALDGVWHYYLKIYQTNRTAIVFHNAYDINVVYTEALQVIDDLRARGY